MGFLRLWLAIIVVCGHVPNNFPRLLSGTIAVSSFYIVSGFYMQLILSDNYSSHLKFWLSRGLKIFPLYWLVTLCTIFYHSIFKVLPQYIFGGSPNLNINLDILNQPHLSAKVFYLFSNLFIFGQSLGHNAVFNTATGQFSLFNMGDNNPALGSQIINGSYFAINGQSWTLDIELMFYIFAPFLLRANRKTLLTIIIFSLVLRLVLGADYWTSNSIFVLELALFCSGALAYRLMGEGKINLNPKKIHSYFIIPMVIAYSYFHPYFSGPLASWSYWGFLILTVTSVPISFLATQKNKIDRWLGDLSYGVYMWHFLMVGIVYAMNVNFKFQLPLVVFLSVVAAILSRYLIEIPVEKFRHSRLMDSNSP